MAKKNRQNPPKPKEFHAAQFSALKGMVLPEAAAPKTEKPLPPKPIPAPEDSLELFLQAVADVKPLIPKSSKAVLPDSSPASQPKVAAAVSAAEEKNSEMFIQEIARLRLDSRFTDTGPEDEELQPLSSNRLRQVRKGVIAVDYQLDLHGLTREEALEALPRFLMSARQRGQKAALIITGKGNHSVEEPVLQQAIASWLREAGRKQVVEYAPAPREMGGSGAFVVFLRPSPPPA